MKQAKATGDEWQELVSWFEEQESEGRFVPDWRRVVFGYRVLVDNCCDPSSSVLDWRLDIAQFLARKANEQ